VSVIAMPVDKNKSERAQSAVEYLRDEARCDVPDIRQKPFKGNLAQPRRDARAPTCEVEAHTVEREVATEPEHRPAFKGRVGGPEPAELST
jgi:hypothetical protein